MGMRVAPDIAPTSGGMFAPASVAGGCEANIYQNVGGTTKQPFVPLWTEGFLFVTLGAVMTYRTRPRRPRQETSCLSLIVRLGVALVLIIALYAVLVRPRVSEYVGQEVARSVGGSTDTNDPREALLPTVVAALPSGDLVLTENQANAYLAANPAALAPLDSARLRFVPGEVQIDISAYGTTSQIRAGLVAENGQIAVVNPQLDGALGLAISIDDLTRILQEQINAELLAQNQRVQALRIEQGQMVVTIE